MIPMPATSLLVYQTDGASGYQYYDGSNWNNFVTSSSLTGYVTTNTTQTITGNKTFTNITSLNKPDDSVYPTNSGGGFYIGGNAGSYNQFNFISVDGSDTHDFGLSQMYSNAEEGNHIRHTNSDNDINASLNINYNDLYLRHYYGGKRTSIYIDGITEKVIIEGSENRFAGLGTSLLSEQRDFEFPNQSGTLALTSQIPSLTGYVTTNTTQTITGNKTFNDVGLIKKTNTAIFPTTSGGNFYIGGNGNYDSFNFLSLDGDDQDSFGVSQFYSNAEEGNYIRHTSLDNQNNAIVQVNYNYMYFRHNYAGQNTSLYIDGITEKVIIEGTQNKLAGLGTALITGTKNFEFPNQSGTLALTSDISGTTNYIPKFIGTTSLGNSRIFDNGTNIGIGTITPNAPIDIAHNNASYGSGINITNSNTSGTAISSISFAQNSPTGYKTSSISLFNDGRMDFLSNEGTFNFIVKSTTSSNAVAMYIDNISNTSRVTIGPSNTASHPLRVTQQVSNVSIYADYDIVAFSDQSVKENIRPIKNVIERIENSRGILYDRIDSGSKDNIGFIAQELEQTFPELVTTNEDGTKAVKYQNAVAVLFEGIK